METAQQLVSSQFLTACGVKEALRVVLGWVCSCPVLSPAPHLRNKSLEWFGFWNISVLYILPTETRERNFYAFLSHCLCYTSLVSTVTFDLSDLERQDYLYCSLELKCVACAVDQI